MTGVRVFKLKALSIRKHTYTHTNTYNLPPATHPPSLNSNQDNSSYSLSLGPANNQLKLLIPVPLASHHTHQSPKSTTKMEPITASVTTDYPHHHEQRKGHGNMARRLLFPRASGLPRGKIRRTGASDNAIKTDVWKLGM